MVNLQRMRSFYPIALILGAAFIVGAPVAAWSYGGGGGAGGGGGGGGAVSQSQAIQPLSRQEIENVFSRICKSPGLSSQTVETMVRVFEGKKVSRLELMKIRQKLLESQRSAANNWASLVSGTTTLVKTVDNVGYYTQVALSFVPGVGWVTVATLSAARSGADTYKQGGDAGQIAKSMAIDGTVSVIMKGSPIGNKGTKSLQRAGQAYRGSQRVVSKTVKKALVKAGDGHLAKGLTLKTIDKYVGEGVKSGLTATTNAVQNSVSSPTYQSSSGGGWGVTMVR